MVETSLPKASAADTRRRRLLQSNWMQFGFFAAEAPANGAGAARPRSLSIQLRHLPQSLQARTAAGTSSSGRVPET
jgi:hypothetical protein